MIHRILVGLGDARYSRSATATAIDLARVHDASLTGISVLDFEGMAYQGPIARGGAGLARELREKRVKEATDVMDGIVDEFAATCEKAGVGFDVRRHDGDPFEWMIRDARYHDVVVCGLQHLFEHGVVEEPPAELVRLVEAGVRPLVAVTDQAAQVKRVLVAYSGSMESAKAMKSFVQMRPWPEASLRIVTFDPSEEHARELLSDAGEYCEAHGFSVETEHVSGAARGQLLPYAAQHDADLIVMGNSAKRLFMRRLFGETMLETVRSADRALYLTQ